MRLAVKHINKGGGIGGRPVELVFEDTKGTPAAGGDAGSRLVRRGGHAPAGEDHSTGANAVLGGIGRSGLSLVFASATLDALSSARPRNVFRPLSPQAYG